MRLGWTILALGSAVLLAGCEKPPKLTKAQEVGQCHMRAAEIFPNWWQSSGADEAMADYLLACMQAKGYTTLTEGNCTLGPPALKTASTCYRLADPD